MDEELDASPAGTLFVTTAVILVAFGVTVAAVGPGAFEADPPDGPVTDSEIAALGSHDGVGDGAAAGGSEANESGHDENESDTSPIDGGNESSSNETDGDNETTIDNGTDGDGGNVTDDGNETDSGNETADGESEDGDETSDGTTSDETDDVRVAADSDDGTDTDSDTTGNETG